MKFRYQNINKALRTLFYLNGSVLLRFKKKLSPCFGLLVSCHFRAMKVESFEILEIRLAVSTKGAVQKQHFEL